MDLKTFINSCSQMNFYNKDNGDLIFAINRFYNENPNLYYCVYKSNQKKTIETKLEFYFIISLCCEIQLPIIIHPAINKINNVSIKYNEHSHVYNFITTNDTIVISEKMNNCLQEIELMFKKTKLTWKSLDKILYEDYLYLNIYLNHDLIYHYYAYYTADTRQHSTYFEDRVFETFKNKYKFYILKYISKNYPLKTKQNCFQGKGIRYFNSFLEYYFTNIGFDKVYSIKKLKNDDKISNMINVNNINELDIIHKYELDIIHKYELNWPENLSKKPDIIEKYIGFNTKELFSSEIFLHDNNLEEDILEKYIIE